MACGPWPSAGGEAAETTTSSSSILDDDTDFGKAIRAAAAAFLTHTFGTENGPVAALEAVPLTDVTIRAGGPAGGHDDWRDYFA